MQMTFDIPEKDLIELGKKKVRDEIQKTLKWLKIKQSFIKVSKAINKLDKKSYLNEIEDIRESAWEEYRKDLEL